MSKMMESSQPANRIWPGLEVRENCHLGRCVFANIDFGAGVKICTYDGDLMTQEDMDAKITAELDIEKRTKMTRLE